MKLNNKGFAISGILYSMLILTVTLMFLILGILAGRRSTLNKVGQEAKGSIEERVYVKLVCSSIDISNTQLFSYDSNNLEQKYYVTSGNYYLIQAWGAAGADAGSNDGGKGAYVSAIYEAPSNGYLYINLGLGGDQISDQTTAPYNGGGAAYNNNSGAGGGATSVATRSNELRYLEDYSNSIILVAAGGGGAGTSFDGGYGGNLENGGSSGNSSYYGGGASPTTGGESKGSIKTGFDGSFGQGGKGSSYSNSRYTGGGGGGYYGGGGGAIYRTSWGWGRRTYYGTGGGGGVSYIKPEVLSTSKNIVNNGGLFNTEVDWVDYIGVGLAGNTEMPKPEMPDNINDFLSSFMIGNDHSGYVMITKLTCSEM